MSRTVPGDARQDWPYEGRDQGYGGGQGVPGSGYGDMTGASASEYDAQAYDDAYDGQGYGQQYAGPGYAGQAYDDYGYAGQGYAGQGYAGQDYPGQAHASNGYGDPNYPGQGYAQGKYDEPYDGQRYPARGFGPGDQGYATQGFGPGDRGYADPSTRQYEQYGYQYPGEVTWQREAQAGQTAPQQQFRGHGDQPTLTTPRSGRGGQGGGARPGQRKVHFRRLRRFFRRPTVRVISALFGVFLVWVMFSAGQAAFKNNGEGFAANLAEWARDHYLGPIVTFGEWMSYNPPKSGGEPTFAYTVPKGEQVTPVAKGKHKGFAPDIPPTVKSLASGPPRPGEGQWRVVEKVNGEPAILITFLRDGGQYTSYSNGIASIDQRLVRFSLRPGTEDPGSAPNNSGNWGVPNYIPSGQRRGLLATFNGGFKLDSAGGGFYLNGMYHGSLVNGAASIVYYKNGTVRIGEWGRDFKMNSTIEGVRQNLQLLVDHGKVSADANSAVKTPNWGATLGGGYWVWRSGIGITKDHRIVFVYGQELDAQDLGMLLQRAGVVEGMQMDINPAWMKFDYYLAHGHPSDPTPAPLLPNQQPSPYSYYSPSTRDFTAVYAQ